MTVDRRPDGPAADEEARLLRRLVDNIPALVSFWDRDQRNVIANQAFVSYFGITPAEMHGRPLRDVIGEELYQLNLADVEAVMTKGRGVALGRVRVHHPFDHVGRTEGRHVTTDALGVERRSFSAEGALAPLAEGRLGDDAVRLFELAVVVRVILVLMAGAAHRRGDLRLPGGAHDVRLLEVDVTDRAVRHLFGGSIGRQGEGDRPGIDPRVVDLGLVGVGDLVADLAGDAALGVLRLAADRLERAMRLLDPRLRLVTGGALGVRVRRAMH